MIEANHIDDLYRQIVKEVDTNPDHVVSPRGMQIKEKLGMSVRLLNPRNCLMTIPSRKLNYKFAIIEKFEYLYGKHDPERIKAYNKNIGSFAGEYGYFDGNYAQRFNFWLDHIYALLKNDPDSRQAVISIYDQTARHQSKDIPCTLNLQFFIRDNKLNLITTMRSNDLLWGFPYDVNAFCFVQEVLAKWLNVELGWYQHNVGSMHIYMNEFYQQVIDSANDMESNGKSNPVWVFNYEETNIVVPMFMAAEAAMRTGKTEPIDRKFDLIDGYMKPIREKWGV
jgi:thymidylate synthase